MDDSMFPSSLIISGGQEFLLEVALAQSRMADDVLFAATMYPQDSEPSDREISGQDDVLLEQLYPALGALPESHTEQLQSLLELTSTDYLSEGADSETTVYVLFFESD
jgi:hypothetical protein